MNKVRLYQSKLISYSCYSFCTKNTTSVQVKENSENAIDLTRRPKSRKNIKEYIKAAKKHSYEERKKYFTVEEKMNQMGKEIRIEDEEGLEWLMNKYVEPSMQKTRLSEFGIKQRELIEKGVIPENARERITLLKTIHSQIISENPGIISSYSKLQLGSTEFYSALEKHIIEYAGSAADQSSDVIVRDKYNQVLTLNFIY